MRHDTAPRGLVRLGTILALLCFVSQCQISQSRAGAPVILVVGDSLSSAYGMDPREGWVALLQQRVEQRGYDYHIVNASVTGETTRGGLARLPRALKQHDPALVILELGGNDGLRGIDPRQMHANLRKSIKLIHEHGSAALLVGVRIPENYGKVFRERFRAVYTGVADETQTPFVPYFLQDIAEHRELMQADGIHPSAPAQEKMLDNVWPVLEPLLRARL